MNKIFLKMGLENIKNNLKYFIVSVMLLTLGLSLFLSVGLTMSQLANNFDKLTQVSNLEDFNFSTLSNIDDNTVNKLEKKYNIKLEKNEVKIVEINNKNIKSNWSLNEKNKIVGFDKQGKFISKNISDDKYLLYIYKTNSNINKVWTKNNIKNNQIVVDQAHYLQRNYNNDSKLKINGEDFNIVSGAFVNHVYPTMDLIMPDTSKILIGAVNETKFNAINYDYKQINYVGTFNNKSLSTEKQQKIYQDIIKDTLVNGKQIIYKLVDKKNNPNISTVEQKISSSKYSIGFISILITFIAVLVVVFLVSKLMNNSRVDLGVLKSFGYRKRELKQIYMAFPIACWAISVVLSTAFSMIIQMMILNLYGQFFSIPNLGSTYSIVVIFIIYLLSFIAIYIIASITISKVLNKSTLEMINNVDNKSLANNRKYHEYKFENKQSFINKMRILIMRTNKKIIFIFSVGFLFASFLLYLGLSYTLLFTNFGNNDYKYQNGNFISYNIPQISKGSKEEINIKQVLLTKSKNEFVYNNNFIQIVGVNTPKSNLIIENKATGKNINNKISKEKVVISYKLATFHNLKLNDKITILDPISNIKKSFTIGYISSLKDEQQIIIPNKLFNDLFDKGKKLHNVNISKDVVNTNIATTIKKDILNDSTNNLKVVEYISVGMIGTISFIISVSLIWILTKQLIEDNKILIETMILLGYKKSEIRKMVINSYVLIMYIIAILSYPLTVFGLNEVFVQFSTTFNVIIELEFSIWHWVIGFIALIGIYYISIWLSTKVLRKTDINDLKNLE